MSEVSKQHNGPSVDCYGLESSSKKNYDKGLCHECSIDDEQRWHAVQETLGIDFSMNEYGNSLVTQDNSGNCFRGAFNPNEIGTTEKWKVHANNAFGTNQHDDPAEDKYFTGLTTGGNSSSIPEDLNTTVVNSIDGKPMTWNLWNVVRHYVYINDFVNKGRELSDKSSWDELESKTFNIVKGIYKKYKSSNGDKINTLVEIESVFERNAREHAASFVLFTGNGVSSYDDILEHKKYNFKIQDIDGGVQLDGEVETLPEAFDLDSMRIDQHQEDVAIRFSNLVDLDKLYPESEYQEGDSTKKWIRELETATLRRQVLPICTSMDDMNIPYTQVTEDDLKGITFQLVPQFFWRYEWDYNDFMIHPVGKLNPNNFGLYDMLGNVWEWVRDDWSEHISSLNGKTNPIVGGTTNSNVKKVIKGGAFDQFARKVITSSREGLNQTQNKSKHGTQPNVGFRPSLTMSADIPTEEKYDIFFLFDASSSNNDSISKMVAQSQEILKKFYNGKKNDVYVGSALFLGPTIRMMCSYNILSQEFTLYSDRTMGCSKSKKKGLQTQYDEDVKNMKSSGANFGTDDAFNRIKQIHYSNIQRYKEYLEGQQTQSRMARVNSVEPKMTPRSDTGNIGGGGSGTYSDQGGTSVSVVIESKRHYYCHVGVPAEHVLESNPRNHLYTCDPRHPEYYEFPFVLSNNGGLSNWWSGCEPVASTLAKLIRDGFFYGEPWSPAIGYIFRPDAKKLIFVFTDEWDNEYSRNASQAEVRETVVIPYTSSKVNTTSSSSYRILQFLPITLKKRAFSKQSGMPFVNATNPLDPFCLQLIRTAPTTISNFLTKMGITGETYNKLDTFSITPLKINNATQDTSNPIAKCYAYTPISFSPVFPQNSEMQHRSRLTTLDGINTTNLIAKYICSDEQVEFFTKNEGKFPGIGYEDGIPTSDPPQYYITSIDYDRAKTIGYYELKSALLNKQDNINVYVITSDSNAPDLICDDQDVPLLYNDYNLLHDLYYGNSNLGKYNWAELLYSSCKHHMHHNTYGNETLAKQIGTVFGFKNPYKTTNTIWAERTKPYISNGVTNNTTVITYAIWNSTSRNTNLSDLPFKYTRSTYGAIKARRDCKFEDANWAIVRTDPYEQELIDYVSEIEEIFSEKSAKYFASKSVQDVEDKYILSGSECWNIDIVNRQYSAGGCLNIVCLTFNGSNALEKDNKVHIDRGTDIWSTIWSILNKNPTGEAADKNPWSPCFGWTFPNVPQRSIESAADWTPEMTTAVKNFYLELKKRMPTLLAYRYYTQMFQDLKNGFGKKVVDYDDSENGMVMKALPISDATKFNSIFQASYKNGNWVGGNVSSAYLVVNLVDVENIKGRTIQLDNFDPNDINFKTKRIAFTRIGSISAQQSDTFKFGSTNLYYDEVTGDDKLYADDEVITSAAPNNQVNVTLTNSGEPNHAEDADKKMHFFIQPYQLTVAQWCYLNGYTEENVKSSIGATKYDEMESSYVKYMRTYENQNVSSYDPFMDTRPYYYATYQAALGAIGKLNQIKAEQPDDNKLNIEFNLPTEAQWEYACKAGSDCAIPPQSNLGKVCETSHPNLDLVAWYKHKVIGTKPEPERFGAWRASKFMFEVAPEQEVYNNVYEHLE